MNHATKVYIHILYIYIYLSYLELRWKAIESHESFYPFEIAGEQGNSRMTLVGCNYYSMDFTWSCNNFESERCLYDHAFKVVNIETSPKIVRAHFESFH